MNPLAKGTWQQRITVAGLILLGAAGTALILYTTAVGPWAYSDSAAYVVTAKNIHAGRGIVLQNPGGNYSLMPLHAPLFPLAVSIPMIFGVGAVQSSRWINAILFGLTISLAGWSTYRYTRSYWLSTGAAGLFLASYEPIKAFSGAMSEGLFIFLGFFSLYCISEGLSSESKQDYWCLAAGILAGLAILARYLGLSILPAGAIAIILSERYAFKVRLKKISLFLGPALLISALWFIPVFLESGSFGGRLLGSLTDVAHKAKHYLISMSDVYTSWLPFFNRGNHIIAPVWKQALAAFIIIAVTAVTLILLNRKKLEINHNRKLTWALVLISFSLCYILLHAATYILAVTQPDVNGRLLLPLYFSLILLGAVLFSMIGQLVKTSWLPNLVFIAIAVFSMWYFQGKIRSYLFDMHNYGMGYTSKRWIGEPIFSQIMNLDSSTRLYSNDSGLVLFYTGRFPYQLSETSDKSTYDLNIPAESSLILFSFNGYQDIGEAYDPFAAAVTERYKVFYEDDTGIILLPE